MFQVWREDKLDDYDQPSPVESAELTAWALGEMDREKPILPHCFFAYLFPNQLAFLQGWINNTRGQPWAYHAPSGHWVPVRVALDGEVIPERMQHALLLRGGLFAPDAGAGAGAPVRRAKELDAPPPAQNGTQLQDPRAYEVDGLRLWSMTAGLYIHPLAVSVFALTVGSDRRQLPDLSSLRREIGELEQAKTAYTLEGKAGPLWLDLEVRRSTARASPGSNGARAHREHQGGEVDPLDPPGVVLSDETQRAVEDG